jgi:hypothetical protein
MCISLGTTLEPFDRPDHSTHFAPLSEALIRRHRPGHAVGNHHDEVTEDRAPPAHASTRRPDATSGVNTRRHAVPPVTSARHDTTPRRARDDAIIRAVRALRLFKSACIVLHRWTSAVLCLLFATWFISGLAMAYQVSPVVSEAQRLQFARPLTDGLAVRAPAEVSLIREPWPAPESLRLGLWNGRPLYRWQTAEEGWQSAWADTGETATFTADAVTPEVQRWLGDGTAFRYVGPFQEHSQWSYFAAARDHYPLHKFSTGGLAARDVFFSSRTGEPVVATTWTTRVMYYLGPGLHYFSFYPIRNNEALWEALVNWSSGIGALTCVLGMVIGLWHLRWRALGTSRRVVPYVKTWMRWHHITGLAFGVLTFTFVLSGLFSMNPGGIFSGTAVPGTVQAAYLGTPPPVTALPPPEVVLASPEAVAVKELSWRWLRGDAFVLARWDLAREHPFRRTATGTIGAMNGSRGQRNRRCRTFTPRFVGDSPPATVAPFGNVNSALAEAQAPCRACQVSDASEDTRPSSIGRPCRWKLGRSCLRGIRAGDVPRRVVAG